MNFFGGRSKYLAVGFLAQLACAAPVWAQTSVCRPGSPFPMEILRAASDATRVVGHIFRITDSALLNLSVQAAAYAYQLPDPSTVQNGVALARRAQEFFEASPPMPGYEVCDYKVDLRSGLKMIMLRPTPEDRKKPVLVSFAGTENLQDGIADLQLGISQIHAATTFLNRNTYCSGRDWQEASSRPVVFTGHSLGGGLAQFFAYQESRRRLGIRPSGKVSLTTFNSLGLKYNIDGGVQNPRILANMAITHFRTESDPVSRLAPELPGTIITVPVNRPFERSPTYIHSINRFRELIRRDILFLGSKGRVEPTSLVAGLTQLIEPGAAELTRALGAGIANITGDTSVHDQQEIIRDAVDIMYPRNRSPLTVKGVSARARLQTIRYLSNLNSQTPGYRADDPTTRMLNSLLGSEAP